MGDDSEIPRKTNRNFDKNSDHPQKNRGNFEEKSENFTDRSHVQEQKKERKVEENVQRSNRDIAKMLALGVDINDATFSSKNKSADDESTHYNSSTKSKTSTDYNDSTEYNSTNDNFSRKDHNENFSENSADYNSKKLRKMRYEGNRTTPVTERVKNKQRYLAHVRTTEKEKEKVTPNRIERKPAQPFMAG